MSSKKSKSREDTRKSGSEQKSQPGQNQQKGDVPSIEEQQISDPQSEFAVEEARRDKQQ